MGDQSQANVITAEDHKAANELGALLGVSGDDLIREFVEEWEQLTPSQQAAFLAAVTQFVDDLASGGGFRNGLRVKGVRGADGVFEMTWAADGRATFHYGRAIVRAEPHVVWRRVGSTRSSAEALDDHGHPLATTYAHRLQPNGAARFLQPVDECGHDARSRHAERVAEGNGSAVHIQRGPIDTQVPH